MGMAAMSVYSIFSISSEYTSTETEMGTRTGAESSNSTPRTSFETLTAGSLSFRKLASYLARLTVVVSVDFPCADRKQDYGSRYQPEAFLSGNLVGSAASEGLIHIELLIEKGADVNGPICESGNALY
jgi:hypothetical protein